MADRRFIVNLAMQKSYYKEGRGMRFKGARILSTVLTMAMLVTMAPDTMRIASAEEMEEATETMITPGDEVQQELEPEENQELDPTQVANYNPEVAKSYAYSHYGTSGEWCAGFVASCLHNAGLTSLDVASNRKVGTLRCRHWDFRG